MFLQSFDKSFVLRDTCTGKSYLDRDRDTCTGKSYLDIETETRVQVNLTLIETETRVQAYFDTPFLNFKIFLKVHIKFLKPIF
jgi:hypothetical protein